LIQEHPEEIPGDEDGERIKNLIDQIDHHVDVLSENFEEVVIIVRKHWKDKEGELYYPVYYRFKCDELVAKSMMSMAHDNISDILRGDIYGNDL